MLNSAIKQFFKKSLLLLPAMSLLSGAALAEKTPFYIGFGLAQVGLGGDMDGDTFLVSDSGAVAVLPDHDKDIGNKFIIGLQSSRNAIEGSIVQSEHDGDWAGIPFSSEYFSFNLDAKFLFTENKLRPFGLLGLGFTTVTVEDGSTNFFTFEDAEFDGFDFRLGLGLEMSLNENVLADFQIVQRIGEYGSVDGVDSGDIEDGVDGGGQTISLEIKYLFL